MAKTNDKVQCFICGKEKTTYSCRGCSQDFCFPHLTEHRQTLGKQVDEIENDQNLLRQSLIEQKEDPKNHLLIKQIDEWEDDSIKKIKQTARECKQRLIEHTNKYIIEKEMKLIKLTEQFKHLREENEFNEIDINQFRIKLTKLEKELDQPPNILIRQDSPSLINKISVIFSSDKKWRQNGITIAAGHGYGNGLNQLSHPAGICIDDDQTIYIADQRNHRLVSWKSNSASGQIVAGGNGKGNRIDQLNDPRDVIMDKQNNSLIISDPGNRRVVRCSRRNGTNEETIISDIDCCGLTMDNNGNLYVSDYKKHEVRRWIIGQNAGTIVAGGNGQGDHLNQLSCPTCIFVDEDYSVYVSDRDNHRVMKWMKDANAGIIVAGGRGQGSSLRQLSNPQGVIVDELGHVYVTDFENDRVMRWCKGTREGNIVVGRNGKGEQSNQFNGPTSLSFDKQGNLYVLDFENNRTQKFEIE